MRKKRLFGHPFHMLINLYFESSKKIELSPVVATKLQAHRQSNPGNKSNAIFLPVFEHQVFIQERIAVVEGFIAPFKHIVCGADARIQVGGQQFAIAVRANIQH